MDNVAFSSCLVKAREVRACVANRKYKLASAALAILSEMLAHVRPTAPLVMGADPQAEADALVAQGECGSPFGMMLQARDLASLLDRIVGDAEPEPVVDATEDAVEALR